MRLRPVARPLVVAVTAILGSGCQVFQPYVIPRHYSEKPTRGSFCNAPPPKMETESSNAKYTDLGTEVAFARSVQRQLSCFARHHAEFAAAMGYTLIPLAALVSYKGFAEAGPHNIAALAAGGAAGYGIARYQYKPRDITYLAGVTAIDCAVQVAQPSILTPNQLKYVDEQKTHLDEASKALDAAASEIASATDDLEEMNRLAQALADTATRKLVRSYVAIQEKRAASLSQDLASLRTRAAAANSRAISLRQYDTIARKDLVNTVEGIVHAVNAQIATQQPDPAVLASLVSPLKMPAAQAAASTTDAGAADDEDNAGKLGDALQESLQRDMKSGTAKATYSTKVSADRNHLDVLVEQVKTKLSTAQQKLQTARTPIEDAETHFTALSTPTNLARLHKQCSIDVQAKAPLTVSLPTGGITVTSGGAAASVPVVGGSKPYSATIVDTTEKGTLAADLKVGVGDAYTLVLAAKDFSEAKTVRVIVQDALGQAVEISVQVKPK